MLFLLLSLQWMGSAVACSCVPPPDNATLFERAKVLVDAEVVKVVDTVQIQGGRLPSVVEMEIKKVYKGAQSLIGKKVKVSGKLTGGTCSSYPPSKIGSHLTLEGPEPYRFSGGCVFVWSPEESR